MVVVSVMWHWVILVAGWELRPEGLGWAVQWITGLFYAYYGLLASPKLSRLQAALGILTGIFDKVSLKMDVTKTVGMVLHPCQIAGGHLEAAYKQRITGVGPSFRLHQ